MRVSNKADYALRALIELADHASADDADTACSAEDLGKAQDIPRGFLQSILGDLRRAEIVTSQRGQSGGWRLAKEAEAINVADVLRAVDGPLVSVHGIRPEAISYQGKAVSLQEVWVAARHSLREVFENVTLAQLAEGELDPLVRDRVEPKDAWLPH